MKYSADPLNWPPRPSGVQILGGVELEPEPTGTTRCGKPWKLQELRFTGGGQCLAIGENHYHNPPSGFRWQFSPPFGPCDSSRESRYDFSACVFSGPICEVKP